MQTIDDLDLLRYVAGGQDIDPSDGGDGGGDGDGDGGGGGGGDGEGVTTADAVASVDAYAGSAIESGIDPTQNAAVEQYASDGQITALADAIAQAMGVNTAVTAAEQAGYNAAMAGQNLPQAEVNAGSTFTNNVLPFVGGYVVGFVKHLTK